MWLLLGGLTVAAAAAVWVKVGAPLARMLAIHEDVSASSRYIPQASDVEMRHVDPLAATGDLRNLAQSIGTRTVDTKVTESAESKSEADSRISKV